MNSCVLMLCLLNGISLVLIDSDNVADLSWCLFELDHLTATEFFGRERLASQKKNTHIWYRRNNEFFRFSYKNVSPDPPSSLP